MSSPLAMSRDEREAFLAETHVAVVSIAEPTRGPLTVPVWYRYQPGGDLRFVTGARSRKGRLIEAAERLSLCVQTEQPPYRYVSVEGPARIDESDPRPVVREMAIRYLGQQMGEMYLAMMAADPESADSAIVVVTPERWYSADYRKLG